MCHPAWAAAHAPAPYPRELVRVRRLRDLIERDCARTVRAAHVRTAHDGVWRLPLDVAALAACSGIPPAQLAREFTRAYGVTPEEYAAARRPEEPGIRPSVHPSTHGHREEDMPCASVVAPAISAGR